MFRNFDVRKRTPAALLLLGLAAMLAACATPGSIIDDEPSYYTQVAGVASAAPLITMLQDSASAISG